MVRAPREVRATCNGELFARCRAFLAHSPVFAVAAGCAPVTVCGTGAHSFAARHWTYRVSPSCTTCFLVRSGRELMASAHPGTLSSFRGPCYSTLCCALCCAQHPFTATSPALRVALSVARELARADAINVGRRCWPCFSWRAPPRSTTLTCWSLAAVLVGSLVPRRPQPLVHASALQIMCALRHVARAGA